LFLNRAARPKFFQGEAQAGKKEGGLGEGIFARLLLGFAKIFSEADGFYRSIDSIP